MELTVLEESPSAPLGRSVYLTNDEWLVLSQALESFSSTYRSSHSATVATYVTRGQLDQATIEAGKMNDLLHRLDLLQVKIIG